MEIKQLNCFVTVADTGSFKKAAHSLFISPPQVSKLIKSLEEELGYTILTRSKSGVALTDNGRKLYGSSVRILKEFDEIELIRPYKDYSSFSVLASHGVRMHKIFTSFISDNDDSNDGFYNFYESSIQPKMKDLYSGRYQIGFTVIEKIRKTSFEMRLKENHLNFNNLKTSAACLYMRKKNPYSAITTMKPDILNNIKFVQLRGGLYIPRIRSGFTTEKKEAFDSDHVGMVTNSLDAAFDIIKKTDMVYVGCDIFGNYDNDADIVKVPLSPEISCVEFGYIVREDTAISKICSDFLEHIRSVI